MHNYTLLYAEDDRETRENYAFVLKKYFKEIYTAEDGGKALEVYREKKPDILLLDISMPKMDGLELVQTLRKTDKETAVIILTAHSEQNTLLKAIPLGLSDYLLKPVDDVLLINTLKKMLSRLSQEPVIKLKQACVWKKNNSELFCRDQVISLTKKERMLMKCLIDSYGHYVLKEMLISEIWSGEAYEITHENKLIQLVYRLNKKVMLSTKSDEQFIENSYALGYKLTAV